MLPASSAARQSPFLSAPWDEQHSDFLAIDVQLPDDDAVRFLSHLVGLLDLGPLTASYAGCSVSATVIVVARDAAVRFAATT